jgi:hypothetical protein
MPDEPGSTTTSPPTDGGAPAGTAPTVPAGSAAAPPPASGSAAPSPVSDDREFSAEERALLANARDPEAVRSMLRAVRAREREAERAIRTAEAAQKKIDDAAKTELERERDARLAAERERDELRRARLALDVAAAEGIPEFADLLRGDTKDKLQREAAALRERVKSSAGNHDLGAGSRLANGAATGASFDDLIRRKAGYR